MARIFKPGTKRAAFQIKERSLGSPKSAHEDLEKQLADHMARGCAGDEPHVMALKSRIGQVKSEGPKKAASPSRRTPK